MQFGDYKSGDRGEGVRQLQFNLNAVGYSLAADGIYGSGTTAAVRNFQQERRLVVDGIAGPQTLVSLSQAIASGWRVGGRSTVSSVPPPDLVAAHEVDPQAYPYKPALMPSHTPGGLLPGLRLPAATGGFLKYAAIGLLALGGLMLATKGRR
jgi:peptidoglycan hydrolase-like protein with peptidoglycan-binding domain